jgi:hypothetical protein
MTNSLNKMIENQIKDIYREDNFGKIPSDSCRISYPTRMKINYIFGVPMKYLNKNKIKNLGELIKITEKYRKRPTEFEKDIVLEFDNLEKSQNLKLNPDSNLIRSYLASRFNI